MDHRRKKLHLAVVPIPQCVTAFQLRHRNNLILTLVGPLRRQSLNSIYCNLHFDLDRTQRLIKVVNNADISSVHTVLSDIEPREFKTPMCLVKTLLKKTLKNLLLPSREKLFLEGVGFKFFLLNKSILQIKLGYSHQIFINVPSKVDITCLNGSKLILSGFSLDEVRTLSAHIRSKKIPDTYKGKGIRFEHERRHLKEGKNVSRI